MELTQARVRELFQYREDGNLIWKITNSNRCVAGSVAGSERSDGYRKIRINGTPHYAHRLIYLWHHGEAPPLIDHADGNPRNNRIGNLRPASSVENQGNRFPTRDNGLPKGVDWKEKAGKWQARITVKKKQVYLGLFDSPEAAHEAYKKAAANYFGEFARAS